MYGFSALFHGVTGSFREPSSHLYQSTLPLPPVSALVGMAGAAVGKTFEDAWPFFMDMGLFVGAVGTVEGKGIDLWNYHKVATPKGADETSQAKQLGWSKIKRMDILNREFLAYPRVSVFYATPEKRQAEELRSAFLNPAYALSLGNSDDIACMTKLSGVCEVREITENVSFRDTFLQGDHAGDIRFDWDALKKTSVVQTLKAPLVRSLIVDFTFNGSERHGSQFKPFTFLSGCQRFLTPKRAFCFDNEEEAVPLYGLKEEG